jgi:hypothetical protein
MVPDSYPGNNHVAGTTRRKYMTNFSLRGLMAAFVLAITLIALPSVASAQDVADTTCSVGCGDIDTTVWSIQAAGAFGGIGMGVFEGTDDGQVDITKEGGADLNLIMNGEGCATIDCTEGASSFDFTGQVYERLGVIVTATGGAEGVPLTVENGGQAAVGMVLQIESLRLNAQD